MLTDLLFIVDLAAAGKVHENSIALDQELTRIVNAFASINDQLDQLMSQLNN